MSAMEGPTDPARIEQGSLENKIAIILNRTGPPMAPPPTPEFIVRRRASVVAAAKEAGLLGGAFGEAGMLAGW